MQCQLIKSDKNTRQCLEDTIIHKLVLFYYYEIKSKHLRFFYKIVKLFTTVLNNLKVVFIKNRNLI